jgi:hypothetical protein
VRALKLRVIFLWTIALQYWAIGETLNTANAGPLWLINKTEGQQLPVTESVIVSCISDDIQYAESISGPYYISHVSWTNVRDFFPWLNNTRKSEGTFIAAVFYVAGQHIINPNRFPISATSNIVCWRKSKVLGFEPQNVSSRIVQRTES